MKYLIDTNIFLRVLIPEDKHSFLECKNVITAIETGSIEAITTSITLAELAWTLKSHYKLTKVEIVSALKSTRGTSNLIIDDSYDNSLAIELFEKHNVKFIDCLLASIPEVQNKAWTIISYDKDFDKLKILKKEPGQIKLK